MFDYLEREKIVRIPEDSGKLVEPFRSVVAIAMGRVREGTIDSLNRQTITLWDHRTSRVYKITDCSVDELGGMVVSTGFLDGDLFIQAFQLDKYKNLLNQLFDIQLPRDPGQVNKENLFLQGGINPKYVKKLAVALSSAKKL